jgi:hypothetical protein
MTVRVLQKHSYGFEHQTASFAAALLTPVVPAKAEYAAAYRFNRWRLGVPDRPTEPVIGLAEGETRWRAMTVGVLPTQFCILAARCVRGLQEISALKSEGVGNAGRPMHPQPRVRYW